MVALERVGLMITIVMMVSGVVMTAIATAEPEIGFSQNLSTVNVSVDDVNTMMNNLNLDFSGLTISEGVTQTSVGALSLIAAILSFFGWIGSALMGWMAVIDLMFAFSTDAIVQSFATALKGFLGFIMLFTLVKYIGELLIKSLPFIGRG
jgi:hypothetical protein